MVFSDSNRALCVRRSGNDVGNRQQAFTRHPLRGSQAAELALAWPRSGRRNRYKPFSGGRDLTCEPSGGGQRMSRQEVVVRLTMHQQLRCEKLGECLWPGEKLSVEEISWRLLLEHLLWAESKRWLVETVRA